MGSRLRGNDRESSRPPEQLRCHGRDPEADETGAEHGDFPVLSLARVRKPYERAWGKTAFGGPGC